MTDVDPALVNRPPAMELKPPHVASPKVDDLDDLPPDFDDVDLDAAVPTRPGSTRPKAKKSVKKARLRGFYSPPPPPSPKKVVLRGFYSPPLPPAKKKVVLRGFYSPPPPPPQKKVKRHAIRSAPPPTTPSGHPR